MNDLSSWCAEEYDRDRPRKHSTRKQGGTITAVCHWCGDGNTFTDTDFGRQMLNAWPEQHDCKDRRNAWRNQ